MDITYGGWSSRHCAVCNKVIEDEYLKIGDNFLQVKYFDDEETENIFCSEECLCKALSVRRVTKDGEFDYV